MSQWLGVTATRKAWEAKVKTSTQRLMLLAIAKYADGDCKAFPSVASLCADTFLNPKTAFKVLKELKGLGLITVEKRPTNNRNQYVVCGGTTENGTTENGTTKNGTTKNGTTKNGTTKNGTTKNGTTVIPKTEQPVIPKTVYEEYQGINQEEKQSIPPPSPAAKREAQTHLFSLAEIPDASKKKPTRQQAFKPPELGVELTESAFRDWMTVRKAKHSPLTETAWKHFKAQVLRSELSIQQAVELCATKGWISINAEWQAVKDYEKETDSRSSMDRTVANVIKALGITDDTKEEEKDTVDDWI